MTPVAEEKAREEIRKQSLAAREHFFVLLRNWYQTRGEEKPRLGLEEIPRWDGGTDRYDVEWKPVWPKLVYFCLQNRINPIQYLSCLFDCYGIASYPDPKNIMNPSHLERFQKWSARFSNEPEKVKSELDCFACEKAKRSIRVMFGYSEDQIVQSVIADPTLRVSPLVRFCLANRHNMTRLSQELFVSALTQYRQSPSAYNTNLGDLIPPALIERVAEGIQLEQTVYLPENDPIFNNPVPASPKVVRSSISRKTKPNRFLDLN